MTDMARCETCAHWRPHDRSADLGDCVRVERGEMPARLWGWSDFGLETAPSFGCTEHQPRSTDR